MHNLYVYLSLSFSGESWFGRTIFRHYLRLIKISIGTNTIINCISSTLLLLIKGTRFKYSKGNWKLNFFVIEIFIKYIPNRRCDVNWSARFLRIKNKWQAKFDGANKKRAPNIYLQRATIKWNLWKEPQ